MSEAAGGDHLDPRVVATRDRVLAAVVRVLEAQGLPGVTHSAVAREAGVGRATVYRHWPSIDDLLADAIEHRLQVAPVDLPGDPVGDLRAMLLAVVDGVLADTDGALFVSLLSRGEVSPQVSALRAEIMGRRIGALRDVVARGIADGSIDPGLDPDDAVPYLVGPLVHRRVVLGRPVSAAFVNDLITRITRVPG